MDKDAVRTGRGAFSSVILAPVACLLIAIVIASCGESRQYARRAAPPPVGSRFLERSIDEVLESLPLANIAFNSPRTLQLHRTAGIQVLLSGQRPISELQRDLTEVGDREGARIRASDVMEANLTGLGFKIEPVTPAEQLVRGDGQTEWKWDIEPTATGRQRLHLTLSAVLSVSTSDSPERVAKYTVRTFKRTLNVKNVPVSPGDRATGFMSRNWQWLFSTLVIPIGLWALHRRRKASNARVPGGTANP